MLKKSMTSEHLWIAIGLSTQLAMRSLCPEHFSTSSTLVDLLKLLPSMFRTDGALIIYLCWEEQIKGLYFI